ncbi:hypothetical protein [Tenacibaculum sp. MAR_2009_124]|uniref:hypothetical protein n=1 Tax=Tenacibaculum sp. MAR_2009_124 TaxID=1250059 RepID=UPI00115FC8DB|nr:hypothetical protein [Tenacibaculum sp. MAR_2009_124]
MNEPIDLIEDNPKIYLGMGIYDIYIIGGWYIELGKFEVLLKNTDKNTEVIPKKVALKVQDFYKNKRVKKVLSFVVDKGGEYRVQFKNKNSLILKKHGFPLGYFFGKRIDVREIKIFIDRN